MKLYFIYIYTKIVEFLMILLSAPCLVTVFSSDTNRDSKEDSMYSLAIGMHVTIEYVTVCAVSGQSWAHVHCFQSKLSLRSGVNSMNKL